VEAIEIEITGKSVNNAESARATSVERFERKFAILPRNIGFAYTLLRQVCRPDRE
jgi:hypothetical protein